MFKPNGRRRKVANRQTWYKSFRNKTIYLPIHVYGANYSPAILGKHFQHYSKKIALRWNNRVAWGCSDGQARGYDVQEHWR